MNQEHGKKSLKTYSSGASYDKNLELEGSKNTGKYFDSENGRVSSSRGDKESWEKIRGEEIVHNNSTTGTWFNLVSAKINDDIFELWVETSNAFGPKIIINGVLMGQSVNMPWLYAHRIQFDVNENCIGGEIFLTDFNVAPMIFSIKDIKDNFAAVTGKYFALFNPNLYYTNLETPLDIPVFKNLVNVGGGGGLPVGSYQYSLRYVTEEGDRTNWSVLTPPIPVLQSVDTSTTFNQYDGIKSYGSTSNILANTSFGIRLKFRVTNLNNYDFIEVRRISYDVGGGIDIVPQGVIVAKIPIVAEEISIVEFIDPSDSNVAEETLADNEESYELSNIDKAKTIRYYDKRVVLMNYETSSKEVGATIKEYNGDKIFPILKDIGSKGFNDPVNHVYHKNYQSAEKYSFAVNFFDGSGGSGFAFEDNDLKNIQVPNRRDSMSVNSSNLSIGNKPTAANVGSTITEVFEIFDHENATGKNTWDSKRNISTKGQKNGTNAIDVGYQPLRPTNKNDVKTDHSYRINRFVEDSAVSRDYDPEGFELDYYTKGFAIGGVEDIPSWVKSFSVVRSDRADRVVCQGIGTYSMFEGDFTAWGSSATAGKDKNKFWFHSPDIYAGFVSQSVLTDIEQNPQNYSIQLVSPLGFFSEVYGFDNRVLLPDRDRIIDMISYARILHDEGQMNPGEDPFMGIGGAERYVAYNRYRNTTDTAGQGAFAGNDGNKEFGIAGFSPITSGRSTYYSLEVDQDVYIRTNVDPASAFSDNDFDEQKMKDFTEPFYIVNIIQSGKVVQDLNINSYLQTDNYQKIRSIIGTGDGNNNQSFELVDERWEDSIPSLLSTDFNSTGQSFVCLVDDNSIERIYMNVSHLTPAQITVITDDITNNGFYVALNGNEVVGIYSHTIDADNTVSLLFDYATYNPLTTERVVIKYDDTRPIVFFGGDTVVGENTFATFDNEADRTGSDTEGQFVMNIGFPYRRYELNSNYFIMEDQAVNEIQSSDKCRLGFIRQLCIMYAAESITATNFSFDDAFPLSYFPMTHYIMRPNKFDNSNFGGGDIPTIAGDNEVYEEYFTDYPQEYTLWKFGGFRFQPQVNTDYSVKGPFNFFSKPDIGFEEKNKFCTGVSWSNSRSINQQDSPALKTFIALNKFFIDDDSGAIVKAWNDVTGGKGDNLYAITETGICLLLTKKSILSNIQADDLSTTASSSFIGGQYWLSREIGSNDEMWRGMADESVKIKTESGKVETKALFIPNKHSVYRLSDNRIVDIIEDDYKVRTESSLKAILPGYATHIEGHFDKIHNEYWLQMPDANEGSIQKCFVYDQNENSFIGRFTYSFDSYLFTRENNYGFRGTSMFEIDKGFQINGAAITGYVMGFCSDDFMFEKEFIDININTGPRGTMKPTEVEFMDEDLNVLCRLNDSLFGPRYLKQYDGWWNQIPRKDISVSASRDRVQYRLILFKIIHTFEEDFRVTSSLVNYKILK